MLRLLPLLCASALLAPVLQADSDKFWFSDPAAEMVEGSQADMIEGVLLDEDEVSYHVRTVGGEVWLPKDRVFKVEKDGLDEAAIAEAEQKERERLAENAPRLAQARAAEHRRRSVRAAEASARRSAAEASATPAPAATPVLVPVVPFDPVLGVAGTGARLRQERMEELKQLWEQTGNRSYLEQLRRMRRMR